MLALNIAGRHLSKFAALIAIAGTCVAADAQSVEFRIIERQGQTAVPSTPGATPTTDAVLNYAVQARVVGGSATQFLGNFSFDIVANGEADAYGTLTKMLISNADGTYAVNTAQSNNAGVGRGGLSAIYTYLAGISPNFNGLINTSAGTFSNTTANQEIGLITGSPTGSSLLALTDTGGSGNPDTYPGSGISAPIDPTIAATYLGAGGNWVDIYRFKYTITQLSIDRFLTFSLQNLNAQIGTSLQLSNGVWGPVQSNAAATATGNTIVVGIIPAPGAVCAIFVASAAMTIRRRRTA